MAFHGRTGDGLDIVLIGNLRVLLQPSGEGWFAQGLEIDYAADGDTIEETKQNFERGFVATIHEHLRIYGSINHFLRSAPGDVWDDFLKGASSKRFSHLSAHRAEPYLPTFEYFTEGPTEATDEQAT